MAPGSHIIVKVLLELCIQFLVSGSLGERSPHFTEGNVYKSFIVTQEIVEKLSFTRQAEYTALLC